MKTPLRNFSLLFLLGRNRILYCFLMIAVFLTNTTLAQTVTTGKSFINISRPNGGTFLPGDIIEVRATIAVNGGTNGNTTRINFVRYNDTVNLAKFTYITGSLQMISNEGRLQQAYGDNTADNDSANIDYATGRLRFNIGDNAGAANVLTQGISTTNAGRLWGTNMRPSFYGGTCIRVYAYRVQIKAAPVNDVDTTILMSAGNFRYQVGSNTTDILSNFSPYRIKISPDYGLCSNSIGANAVVGESGGTFGSGTAQNRAGGTTFVPLPYTFVNFASAAPNDNFYGLANRTSSDGTTNPNVNYSTGTGSASRVFSVWDIIGDHTGAVDPLAGNPPTNKGYAVIINASYETNRAFTQNITGLCEDTYYEFSAWFRNICRRCGCDSSGKGATTTNYKPTPNGTPGGDSSGVHPNLSFQIDGEDFYTSGNIPYTGKWVKKGFVFKTKHGQNAMTVTIRNNAPGGGGNDWAIDDIGVSTCLPNMKYSPSITPNVCKGNALTLYDTVRSYFNNYTYFQWQVSTDGGTTWTNIGGVIDSTGMARYNATLNVWEYVGRFTTPVTTLADNGKKYRVIVATSSGNLTNATCRSTDATSIVTLSVTDCGPLLNAKLISFNGKVNNGRAALTWITTGETDPMYYDVERSYDGINFTLIGTVNSTGTSPGDQNTYYFNDLSTISGKAFYRIKMRTIDNKADYSRVLQLANTSEPFAFVSVVNPFHNELFFDISSDKTGKANAQLVSQLGNVVKKNSFDVTEGVNALVFENMSSLPAGIYILRVQLNDQVIYKRVLKQNQ